MNDESIAAPLGAPGPVGRMMRLGLERFSYTEPGTWRDLGPSEIGRQLVNPIEWLIHMGIALWLFPSVVDIGWNRNSGFRIRPLVLGGAGILILISRLIDGEWWGPIVGWPMLVATIDVFAHSGVSSVVSAVLATPGCEMRALPDLSARLRNGQFTPHACPGLMADVDRWEAELVTRRGQ